jgi:hypothetical protein
MDWWCDGCFSLIQGGKGGVGWTAKKWGNAEFNSHTWNLVQHTVKSWSSYDVR